jgi:thiol-disulfide isomerase/thioredoxin
MVALAVLSGCRPGDSSSSNGGTSVPPAKPEGPPTTARQALERMVAAYHHANSYSDEAVGRFMMKSDRQNIDQSFPFAVSLERPNRLAMKVYAAHIACDGQTLRATIDGLNQVLVKPAPAPLSMQGVFSDPLLGEAANTGPAGPALQLAFMLGGNNPLEQLLQSTPEQKLLEPAAIEGRQCYRASLVGPMGTTLFWIDCENYLLRRLELPVEEYRQQQKAAGRNVEQMSSIVDFKGAQFSAAIAPEKFQLNVPAGTQEVKLLVKPNPAQLLGKKIPEFQFLDLDHKPVTPAALAGKITVLEFWATNCPPCRVTLPKLNAVAQKYKQNSQVAFLAVSVDPPDVAGGDVADSLKQLSVALPVVRDQDAQVNRLFFVEGIPTLLLVGPGQVVEDFEVGMNPDLEKTLPEKIDRLLAGTHLYEEGLRVYQEQLKKTEQAAAMPAETKEAKPPEIPPAKIAPASEPSRLHLKSLWKCTELPEPGNILVVPRGDGSPRILVLDNWRAVVELGPDGKLQSRHELDIPKQEAVSMLSSAVDGSGHRYFAGWTTGQQQVHLFDENFKTVLDFPADALENKHPGISHALLADLTGEGKLLLYVGYWGTVGVQAVAFDGKRVWSNRSLENVFYLALSPANAQRQRQLLCLDTRGMAVVIDAKGQRKEEILMGLRPVQTLVGPNRLGEGSWEYCGVSQKELGSYVAVGLDLSGKELWTYELPKGHPQMPITFVVSGSVLPAGPPQWLLPAADGSIHILSEDGKLFDRFNYGSALSGLATTLLDGRPVLLIASPQGVEALRAE